LPAVYGIIDTRRWELEVGKIYERTSIDMRAKTYMHSTKPLI
jgi:hypothetical protein